jgi:hypothetical protein
MTRKNLAFITFPFLFFLRDFSLLLFIRYSIVLVSTLYYITPVNIKCSDKDRNPFNFGSVLDKFNCTTFHHSFHTVALKTITVKFT